MDDFARVEKTFGVEALFQLAKSTVEFGSEHLLLERGSYQPVAVFARERTAVFEDQVGDLVGDAGKLLDTFSGFHIDDRADVQESDRGVGVKAGWDFATGQNGLKTLDIVVQIFRGDSRILNK